MLHDSLNASIICVTVLGFLNLKTIKPVPFVLGFSEAEKESLRLFVFFRFPDCFCFSVHKNMHILYGNVKKKRFPEIINKMNHAWPNVCQISLTPSNIARRVRDR